MSKKKQATDEMLKEVLENEKKIFETTLEPSGSGIVESLNNIDQVINEFESGESQPAQETNTISESAFDPFAARVKAIKIKLLSSKFLILKDASQTLLTEYHNVCSGHTRNYNVFMDAIAFLESLALEAVNNELAIHKITWEELQQAITKPDNSVPSTTSSSEPPEAVPSSPSPVEEPLKDPSPTDQQPSND